MSTEQDEYGFLNNIDNKVFVAMCILVTVLTGGAIVLNLAVSASQDCTTHEYVYCGETAGHGHDAPH